MNGYLLIEYTLFQHFARKIPHPAPPTGRPGPVQSGCTQEFGYGPINAIIINIYYYLLLSSIIIIIIIFSVVLFLAYLIPTFSNM